MAAVRAVSPVFDHRESGTPVSAWEPARAGVTRRALVSAHDHLAVVAAHPDDETLGAGGLIAEACRANARITVVVVTDGEASHPGSPSHEPDELARIRQREVTAAVRALAPQAELVLLHRPDGSLAAAGDNLTALLLARVDDATVIAVPWRGDGHPDHEACAAAAAAVRRETGARLLEYPIWGWHWGEPGHMGPLHAGRWVALQLTAEALASKLAAIGEHPSQCRPLSAAPGDEAVLSPGMLEHFTLDHEIFLESEPSDVPARYFDRLYADDHDPWHIETGFYEERKRQLLLAALPRARFRSAFEPGCAGGRTTVELASRCDRVLACDVSAAAVAATQQRTADLGNVAVVRANVPQEWPDGKFDLVVVSELGYYLADPAALAARIRAALTEDGVVVACHWRHPAAGYPSAAPEVHAALGHGLHRQVQHVEPDFLLDVWSRDPTSVAAEQGVLS